MTDISQIDPASDEPKDLRSRIGAEAARATTAETEAATLRRELAVERAGLPDFPGKQFFLSAYSGEPTPEAVKQAAAEAGFINADGSPIGGAPAQQQVSQEELDRQRQIVGASSGAQTPSSGDIDLAVALRNCKSQGEVMAIVAQMAGNPGFKSREGLIGVLPEF
jgi:hypothetical protein